MGCEIFMPFPQKRYRSKKEFAYDTLRTAILNNDLAPGDRLIIDEIAQEMGVSPIPVREALRDLEADGFVTIQPYVGATVTRIHTNLLKEIFELLEALELISGRAACSRLNPDDYTALETMLRDMDTLTDDPNTWSAKNTAFHEYICDRAETPLVKDMMTHVLNHWERLRSTYLKDVFATRLKVSQPQHWQMLDALRNCDNAALERVVREHNHAAMEVYAGQLKAKLGEDT